MSFSARYDEPVPAAAASLLQKLVMLAGLAVFLRKMKTTSSLRSKRLFPGGLWGVEESVIFSDS